jgi:predicted Zn finger-like uncharacterized protein
MIVQCAKCGTKYNLDDTKVKLGETKVRCSHCQYVFTIPLPLPLGEKENFGTTNKKDEDPFLQQWAKELTPQAPSKPQQPVPPTPDEGLPPKAFTPPMEDEDQQEENPFEEAPSAEDEMLPFQKRPREEAQWEKRSKVSATSLLTLILVVAVGGSLYYWWQAGGSVPAFEYIYEKVYKVVEREKAQKIFILSRRGREYQLDGEKVYVIQGKVANRTEETKRVVKLKATLYDQEGKEIATSIGYCGITMSDKEIIESTYDGLKTSFGFIGASQAAPVPPQQSVPFTIIFFSPPAEATNYDVIPVETAESE